MTNVGLCLPELSGVTQELGSAMLSCRSCCIQFLDSPSIRHDRAWTTDRESERRREIVRQGGKERYLWMLGCKIPGIRAELGLASRDSSDRME